MRPARTLRVGHQATLAIAVAVLGVAIATISPDDGPSAHARPQSLAEGWTVEADFSPLSPAPGVNTDWRVTRASGPAFGPLLYDPDLRAVEAYARSLLERSKAFRRDVSPFQDSSSFEQLVANFDYGAGFAAAYKDATLRQAIDQADSDLRLARDAYAFLTAMNRESDFRSDERNAGICLRDPAMEDLFADTPTIDWCNFPARTRESLREAAYIRMIFGQQFTADALGYTFSGNLVGGDSVVAREIHRLEEARHQYRRAREAVAEGMWTYVGRGCFVSDFYSDTEWLLLSRAVEGLERAGREIAMRRSYLSSGASLVEDARQDALQTLGQSSTEQYLDLLLAAGQDISAPCSVAAGTTNHAVGEDVVSKMLAGLERQRQAAAHLRERRNVFGYDVRFTPARPFGTQKSTGTGLYDQAADLAEKAQSSEDRVRQSEQYFNWQRNELAVRISDVKTRYDNSLAALTGCAKPDPAKGRTDAEFLKCAEEAPAKLQACDPLTETDFEGCVMATGVTGELLEEWRNYQEGLLELRVVEAKRDGYYTRATFELERSATVRDEILTNGEAQSIMEFAATILDSLNVEVGTDGASVSYNPAQPAIAVLRQQQTLRQAAADAAIESANSEAVVRNLLLDAVEISTEMEVVGHQLRSQYVTFSNLAAGTQDLVVEARRARDYVKASPANDPSFRLILDGDRLALAEDLALAARTAYLAAKRLEYEYAYNLSQDAGFSISDIYRARNASDVTRFLTVLDNIANNAFLEHTQLEQKEFTLSVARHVLGLTDEALGLSGIEAETERSRLFGLWVADHVEGEGEKAKLTFALWTSPDDKGVFATVMRQTYPRRWLHKASGTGQPLQSSIGFGINLVVGGANASALGYRDVFVSQGGVVHLKGMNGCIYEYRLLHPAALIGLKWPEGESADSAQTWVEAQINGAPRPRVQAFAGRPVSATGWSLQLSAGAPEDLLPVMDLAELKDIELLFDSTCATRTSDDPPDPQKCIRVDY